MPYTIVPTRGKFCVHKEAPDGSPGKRVACHDTRKQAAAQIGALESAEQKSVDIDRGLSAFKMIVGADGQLRWMSASSNSYRDREDEIISAKSLRLWAEYAHKTNSHGQLLWGHDKSLPIGDCDASLVHGAFLLETGPFHDTPLGNKAINWLMEDSGQEFGPMGVSIGFYYDSIDKEGVYNIVSIEERSVLPLSIAANENTAFIPLKQ